MKPSSAGVPLSTPAKSVIWGLPTPPPSLSGLSTLAAASSPPRSTGSKLATCDSNSHLSLPTAILSSSTSSSSLVGSAFPTWTTSDLGLNVRPRIHLGAAVAVARRMSKGIGAWLGLYLTCSLALTLHNKHLLNGFPFPWTLTAIHAFSAALGSSMCAYQGVFKPAPLNHPTTPLLALFSFLYSINIAASNASLRLVSIATHQVVRAATPLFVIFFAWVRTRRVNVSPTKLKSLIPVVLGVGFATYGDYTFTQAGLALTLAGTALAALKTMLASWVVRTPKSPIPSLLSAEAVPNAGPLPVHSIPESMPHYSRAHIRRSSMKRFEDEGYLSGDERPRFGESPVAKSSPHWNSRSGPESVIARSDALHPLDVLLRLSPLACIQCLIVAWGSGEMGAWKELEMSVGAGWNQLGLKLAMNGVLAFVLNYVSFMASRRAGALSMTVAANIKQVLTVLFALFLFDPHMPSFTHILGIGLTLAGGVWYGLVEAQEKQEREEKMGI
ncbi:Triose-phosphate Transporter family [Ceratobasidium sp. AG-Ba]|nr:Triose-phosphate Transporter family [Ceratobasidium sp. AG-Ba]